jgi:hypothetical protein
MIPKLQRILDKYLPFKCEKDVDSFFIDLQHVRVRCGKNVREAVYDQVRELMLLRYFVRKAEKHNEWIRAREEAQRQYGKKGRKKGGKGKKTSAEKKPFIHIIYTPMGGQNKRY